MAAHFLDSAMHTMMWPFIVVLFLVPALLGQADQPIQGIVVTQDGQPIAGVSVYGSLGKCCPVQREQTTTDKNGAFRLQRPGTVIHFFKENLQPQSIVIQPGSSALRSTMSPDTNAMSVSSCGPRRRGQERLGLGTYGLQFTVSGPGFDVQGGRPDIDYVRYVIKRKQSPSFLELWFGPTAMRPDPDDDRFIESNDFVQRLLLIRYTGDFLQTVLLFRNATAGLYNPGQGPDSLWGPGLDSWGHLRGGGSWRHTAIWGMGGATYNKASSEDAVAFDQVINSVCFVPYPSK
jgi:hypothetical protein